MKKLLFIFISLCVCLSTWAYSFTEGGIYYNVTSSTLPYAVEVTYATTDYNSYSGSITIPSTVTNSNVTYNVTSIGNYAFYHCTGLTSITIPSSVTNIGMSSFDNCTSLTNITIPSSVTTIGPYVFYSCAASITVDSSNSNYSSMDGVLYNKDQTTLIYCPTSKSGSFNIPSTVTSIGIYAFYNCTSLSSINIPSSVTSIETYAFSCPALISVDSSNSNYMSIDGVLYNKNQTILIQYPVLRSGSFNIPSSVTSIGNGAFYNCTGLTAIAIPSSVTSIGSSAFYNCTGITAITIPSLVTTIGSNAFYNCTGLTSVTIPSSVSSIRSNAFAQCPAFITVDSSNSYYSSMDGVLYNKNQTTLIQCPTSKSGSFNIPSSVTSIGAYACYFCTSLTTVTIPSSVITIGTSSFSNCTSLTTVTIPSSVTTFASNAFSKCTSLNAIYSYLTAPMSLWNNQFPTSIYTSCTLFVPTGTKSLYQSAPGWQDFTNISELTGIKETYVNNISIYPGITQSDIEVNLDNKAIYNKLTIYNIHGQKTYETRITGNHIQLNVSSYPAGVYMIQASGNNNSVIETRKFIKK